MASATSSRLRECCRVRLDPPELNAHVFHLWLEGRTVDEAASQRILSAKEVLKEVQTPCGGAAPPAPPRKNRFWAPAAAGRQSDGRSPQGDAHQVEDAKSSNSPSCQRVGLAPNSPTQGDEEDRIDCQLQKLVIEETAMHYDVFDAIEAQLQAYPPESFLRSSVLPIGYEHRRIAVRMYFEISPQIVKHVLRCTQSHHSWLYWRKKPRPPYTPFFFVRRPDHHHAHHLRPASRTSRLFSPMFERPSSQSRRNAALSPTGGRQNVAHATGGAPKGTRVRSLRDVTSREVESISKETDSRPSKVVRQIENIRRAIKWLAGGSFWSSANEVIVNLSPPGVMGGPSSSGPILQHQVSLDSSFVDSSFSAVIGPGLAYRYIRIAFLVNQQIEVFPADAASSSLRPRHVGGASPIQHEVARLTYEEVDRVIALLMTHLEFLGVDVPHTVCTQARALHSLLSNAKVLELIWMRMADEVSDAATSAPDTVTQSTPIINSNGKPSSDVACGEGQNPFLVNGSGSETSPARLSPIESTSSYTGSSAKPASRASRLSTAGRGERLSRAAVSSAMGGDHLASPIATLRSLVTLCCCVCRQKEMARFFTHLLDLSQKLAPLTAHGQFSHPTVLRRPHGSPHGSTGPVVSLRGRTHSDRQNVSKAAKDVVGVTTRPSRSQSQCQPPGSENIVSPQYRKHAHIRKTSVPNHRASGNSQTPVSSNNGRGANGVPFSSSPKSTTVAPLFERFIRTFCSTFFKLHQDFTALQCESSPVGPSPSSPDGADPIAGGHVPSSCVVEAHAPHDGRALWNSLDATSKRQFAQAHNCFPFLGNMSAFSIAAIQSLSARTPNSD